MRIIFPSHRLYFFAAIILALLIIVAVAVRVMRLYAVQSGATLAVAQWVYLSDLEWERAVTGWVAIANDGLPSRDMSFTGKPITIAGVQYEKGLGTYPVSEIVYSLGGAYVAFEAEVGLDDEVPSGSGGVEFKVFVDGALLYSSGVVYSGDPVKPVKVDVSGAQSLRLVVTDASDGAIANYADWADARLSQWKVGGGTLDEGLVRTIQSQLQRRKSSREADQRRINAVSAREVDLVRRLAGHLVVGRGAEIGENQGKVFADFDKERGQLVIGNNRLAVELGYGGKEHGKVSLIDLRSGTVMINKASPTITLTGKRTFSLAYDSLPLAYDIRDITDSTFGNGKSIEGMFLFPETKGEAYVSISVFDSAPYAVYRISLNQQDVPLEAGLASAIRFSFFSLDSGELMLGSKVEYVTDVSRLRYNELHDDGVLRKESIDLGKPVFLRDRISRRGMILAAIDETVAMPEFGIVTDMGKASSRFYFRSSRAMGGASDPHLITSSRLYLEITESDDFRDAFNNFRRAMGELYPPAPLPGWVKYQWLSWYPFYMDINEKVIREQIDYIAENLSDLGQWSVLVDAGWYVAEGRENSDWRNVDQEKFPSGLRALVDYAHAKGVKVILYFSSPYLDSREQPGDWLGLRGFIEKHRDWLLVLGKDERRTSFVYDFRDPGLQEYMRSVLADFFVQYNVDGIKVDGLGNAEGAVLDDERLNEFGMVDRISGQTMTIYRFVYENARSLKKDAYVESGWLTPLLANPFSHTFRFGDEREAFSGRYPFPGLIEHADYAAFQKVALGQRPNMGAILGDPNVSIVNLWWLQAGLALGTKVVLSFDLSEMSDEALNDYRQLLVHYNAFQGETRYGDKFESRGESFGPNSYASLNGPYIYLGVVNRAKDNPHVTLRLEDFGIQEGQNYVALDVGAKQYFRTSGIIEAYLPAESFRLFVLRKDPGIMWTNSSFSELSSDKSGIEFVVKGPSLLTGFVEVFAPNPREVSIDGINLYRSAVPAISSDQYYYDESTGIMKIVYSHDRPHRIRIRH